VADHSLVALLRAVNVGGTGKLAMSDLKAICEAAGFSSVRTYIASGNVVFRTGTGVAAAKKTLEAALETHAGKPLGVVMRTAEEMASVLAAHPFPEAPANQVIVLFLDGKTSPKTLDGVTGQASDEVIRLGPREIYVWYGSGIGRSKLKIPGAKDGTGRNVNTVAKLAEMAAEGANY
jgi:uncharacterized protein (DUF1697 family)